jgi:hypothetical protein
LDGLDRFERYVAYQILTYCIEVGIIDKRDQMPRQIFTFLLKNYILVLKETCRLQGMYFVQNVEELELRMEKLNSVLSAMVRE